MKRIKRYFTYYLLLIPFMGHQWSRKRSLEAWQGHGLPVTPSEVGPVDVRSYVASPASSNLPNSMRVSHVIMVCRLSLLTDTEASAESSAV